MSFQRLDKSSICCIINLQKIQTLKGDILHILCDVMIREKSYQDTEPGSNDELTAIRLEGKIINTEKVIMVRESN